jgi:beta-lactamase regulating signal transducer with metallopeptidase domain
MDLITSIAAIVGAVITAVLSVYMYVKKIYKKVDALIPAKTEECAKQCPKEMDLKQMSIQLRNLTAVTSDLSEKMAHANENMAYIKGWIDGQKDKGK